MRYCIYIAVTVFMCLSATVEAQLDPYQFRIGVHGGFSNYYGDLSPNRIRGLNNSAAFSDLLLYNSNMSEGYSFLITAEKRLNSTIGLMLSAGQYTIAGNDRFTDRKGSLLVNNPNFSRSLNFKTEIQDVGLSLVFKTDNGKLLRKNALIAPYLSLGFGVLRFENSADLVDDNGMPYNFSVEPMLQQNRDFETRLAPLNTEGVNYSTSAFYTNLGLGFRLRLGYQVELNFYSNFNKAFTDFLDDVSGTVPETFSSELQALASNPGNLPANAQRGSDNRTDFYIFHGVGLRFSFGQKKQVFNAPIVMGLEELGTDGQKASMFDALIDAEKKSSTQKTKRDSAQLIQYFTTILFPNDSIYRTEASRQIFELQNEVDRLKIEQEVKALQEEQARYRRVNETLLREINRINQEDSMSDSLKQVTTEPFAFLRRNFADSIQLAEQRVQRLNSDLETVNTRKFTPEKVIPTEIDTLKFTKVYGDRVLDFGNKSSREFWRDSMLITILERQQMQYITAEPTTQRQPMGSTMKQEGATQDTAPSKVQRSAEPNDSKPSRAELRAQQATERDIEDLTNRVRALEREGQGSSTRKRVDVDSRTFIEGQDNSMNQFNRTMQRQNQLLSALLAAQVGGTAVMAGSSGSDGENNSFALLYLNQQEKMAAQDSILKVLTNRLDSLEQESKLLSATPVQSAAVVPSPSPRLPVAVEAAKMLETTITPPAFTPRDTLTKVATPQTIKKVDMVVEQAEPQQDAVKTTPRTNFSAVEFITNKVQVFFALNSSTFTPEEAEKLNELIPALKRDTQLRVRLTGYADNSGNINYNLALCKRRIDAVKQYLVQNGIDSTRMETVVGGQLVRGANQQNEPNDRRVEIVVIP
ncbi:MAG: OmpA family protein [Luteibaculaceae bacterium]